jgi:hypothetical protein
MRWNERTRLRGSTGRPVLVVKISPEFAIYALDLLPDADLAVLLVHVAPAEPEHFTTPQAIQEQEHEGWVERITLRSVEEHPSLGGAPRRDRLAFPTGQTARLGISTGTPVAEHIRTGYTAADRPVRVMVSIIPGDALILQYTIPTLAPSEP